MVKDAVPLRDCARALVVKLAPPGDVLLASPVFSVLAARGVEADALVYADAEPMLAGHPHVSRLHVVGRREITLFAALRRRAYTLLVHLTAHVRGAWLARSLGVRYSVAPLARGRGGLWRRSFTHLYRVAARRHEVELNLDALRRIGVYPDERERALRFVPGAEAERKVQRLAPDAFLQLHPAAGWPAEKYAALVDRLVADGHRVVVTGMLAGVMNLAGQLSLKELGALAGRAQVFIGEESAAMHLAAAMGTAVVGLCGGGAVERAPWKVAHRSFPDCASPEAVRAAVAELAAA
jgi:heptosyltransferase-3